MDGSAHTGLRSALATKPKKKVKAKPARANMSDKANLKQIQSNVRKRTKMLNQY